MKHAPRALIALLLLLHPTLHSTADAQEAPEPTYAQTFGDGLRYYAEGRYDLALKNLYRAYAVKPTGLTMSLIVRSYDFMGHCSAAERQLTMLRELHPRHEAPSLQLCRAPGTVEIDCVPTIETVTVNRRIEVPCGTDVRLPPGEHLFLSTQMKIPQRVQVESGLRTKAEIIPAPEKWYPNAHPDHARLPEHTPLPARRVSRSGDGLYQIWVPSQLRADPDMSTESEVPGLDDGDDRGLFDLTPHRLSRPDQTRRSAGDD